MDSHISSSPEIVSKKNVKKDKLLAKHLKVPSLKILQRRALEKGVTIYGLDGKKLTQMELYTKLKILNMNKESPKRVYLKKKFLKDIEETQLKKLLAKEKQTKTDKKQIDIMLYTIDKIEKRKKFELRERYNLEEIKIFDAIYMLQNMSDLKIHNILEELTKPLDVRLTDIHPFISILYKLNELQAMKENELERIDLLESKDSLLISEKDELKELKNNPKSKQLLEKYIEMSDSISSFFKLFSKVKKDCFHKIVKKYVDYPDPLTQNSRLLLYKILENEKSCLNEPISEQEILDENERFKRLEQSFLTTQELRELEKMDVQVETEKMNKQKELQRLKHEIIQLNKYIIKSKQKDSDDDGDDLEHMIEKLRNLEEQKRQIKEWLEKYKKENTLEYRLENEIMKLKLELTTRPIGELDANVVKSLEDNIEILQFNPFATKSGEIGRFILVDPFEKKPQKASEKMQIEGDIKISDKFEDFVKNELKVLKFVRDLLITIDTTESFKLFSELNKIKFDYSKSFSVDQIETIRFMIRKINKKEVIDEALERGLKELVEIQSRNDLLKDQIIAKQKRQIDEIKEKYIDHTHEPFLDLTIKDSQFMLRNKIYLLSEELRIIREIKHLRKENVSKDVIEEIKLKNRNRLKELNLDLLRLKGDNFDVKVKEIRINVGEQDNFKVIHECLENYFKKPWITGYSGIFYVKFLNSDIPVNFLDKTYQRNDYFRGTRHLDILLCKKIGQEGDVTIFRDEDVEYRVLIQYEVLIKKINEKKIEYITEYIDNDERIYEKEMKWIKNKKQDAKKEIQHFSERLVSSVDIKQFIISELSTFFEKENAEHIATELIREYHDQTVGNLFDRLGGLVIFLDLNYMKTEAQPFNNKLNAGTIKENEILKMSPMDILYELVNSVNKIPLKYMTDLISGLRYKLYEKCRVCDSLRQNDVYPKWYPDGTFIGDDDLCVVHNTGDLRVFSDEEIENSVDIREFVEYIIRRDKSNSYKYSIKDIIDKFPEFYKIMFKINITKMDDLKSQITDKIKKSIEHYVKKLLYKFLTLHRMISSGSIPSFQYNKIFKSLEQTDCFNKVDFSQNDTVYYVEDYKIYCFSLSELLLNNEKQNKYTKKMFSKEFLQYLEHLRLPEKIQLKNIQKTPSLLDDLYSDLRMMDSKVDFEFPQNSLSKAIINQAIPEESDVPDAPLEESDYETDASKQSDVPDAPLEESDYETDASKQSDVTDVPDVPDAPLEESDVTDVPDVPDAHLEESDVTDVTDVPDAPLEESDYETDVSKQSDVPDAPLEESDYETDASE